MWPWSYDRCGEIDHLETKQEINACLPDPGHGLHPHQGRGAPEIDKTTQKIHKYMEDAVSVNTCKNDIIVLYII